jgi:hypothetical protein
LGNKWMAHEGMNGSLFVCFGSCVRAGLRLAFTGHWSDSIDRTFVSL